MATSGCCCCLCCCCNQCGFHQTSDRSAQRCDAYRDGAGLLPQLRALTLPARWSWAAGPRSSTLVKPSGALDFDARRISATMMNASSDVDGLARMSVNPWTSLQTAEIQSSASRRVYEVDERQGLGHARPVDGSRRAPLRAVLVSCRRSIQLIQNAGAAGRHLPRLSLSNSQVPPLGGPAGVAPRWLRQPRPGTLTRKDSAPMRKTGTSRLRLVEGRFRPLYGDFFANFY